MGGLEGWYGTVMYNANMYAGCRQVYDSYDYMFLFSNCHGEVDWLSTLCMVTCCLSVALFRRLEEGTPGLIHAVASCQQIFMIQ